MICAVVDGKQRRWVRFFTVAIGGFFRVAIVRFVVCQLW